MRLVAEAVEAAWAWRLRSTDEELDALFFGPRRTDAPTDSDHARE